MVLLICPSRLALFPCLLWWTHPPVSPVSSTTANVVCHLSGPRSTACLSCLGCFSSVLFLPYSHPLLLLAFLLLLCPVSQVFLLLPFGFLVFEFGFFIFVEPAPPVPDVVSFTCSSLPSTVSLVPGSALLSSLAAQFSFCSSTFVYPQATSSQAPSITIHHAELGIVSAALNTGPEPICQPTLTATALVRGKDPCPPGQTLPPPCLT